MKFPEFITPVSLDQGLEIKREHGTEARVIAGGTDLILRMRDKLLSPAVLIDLRRASLDAIAPSSDYLGLGASLSVSGVIENADIARMFPALAAACSKFAGPPIRNRATLAGNIANASPAADLVPPMIAYDADIVLRSSAGERILPLAEFFVGPGQSVIEPNEILTQIRLPLTSAATAASFIKLGQRRSMAISQVNLATRLCLDARGMVSEARIVLGAVAPVPMRAVAAEAMLTGKELSGELLSAAARKAREEAMPISDIRASRAYRLQMTEVLVRRALLATRRELAGGRISD
ncbi:MAG: xanthine dehydrogenase family protein subunit M [Gammaproteobacteria bacterium]|nr:xanthine dehydrogenase family protein subunit M [Gammaproteobacteria bacterium]